MSQEKQQKKLGNRNSINIRAADGCQTENVEMQKLFICRKTFLRDQTTQGASEAHRCWMICWKMPRITNAIKLSDQLIEKQSFSEQEDHEYNLPRNSLAVLISRIVQFYSSQILRSKNLEVCKIGTCNKNLKGFSLLLFLQAVLNSYEHLLRKYVWRTCE